MELRHLRYVVAVADRLHFGQAAEQLHISQPPLSQQIRQLEDELGVRLFLRTKRQVRLTEAGRLFVDEARLILAQADHAAKLAMRASSGEAGQITIGISGAADTPVLLEIFRRFACRHANIRIVLRSMGTAPQTQALREGRLHVGCSPPSSTIRRWRSRRCCASRWSSRSRPDTPLRPDRTCPSTPWRQSRS